MPTAHSDRVGPVDSAAGFFVAAQVGSGPTFDMLGSLGCFGVRMLQLQLYESESVELQNREHQLLRTGRASILQQIQ